jgi:TonB-linked SusC/RagA family outer membrane protein
MNEKNHELDMCIKHLSQPCLVKNTAKKVRLFLMLLTMFTCMISLKSYGSRSNHLYAVSNGACFQDTTKQDTTKKGKQPVSIDSVVLVSYVSKRNVDTIKLNNINLYPFISLQQALKSSSKGVYVQEITGEPGSADQSILLRGLSRPLLSKGNIAEAQPAIFVNGIPLIVDNPFVYTIQEYDFSPIGPATNLLSAIDLDNIQSINVISSLAALSIYGPRAANGAILITTKNAHQGSREISVNSYYGFAAKNKVTTTNGHDESVLRNIFYNRYATPEDFDKYPSYLADATNENYYGRSDWTDLYYKNSALHTINASITGGTSRSNFRFFAGNTSNAGNADDTRLDRYNASFFINVLPLKWLTISTMVNATRLNRDRNRSLRDRFAEMQYVPDLISPIAPNKNIYGNYLSEYENKTIDNNINNVIQGSFSASAKYKNFDFISRISFDYNEGMRDLFYPTTLMDGNNYVSNFYGYNQRLNIDNSIAYNFTLNKAHVFKALIGHTLSLDVNKYNYLQGYKGTSDYIRINSVDGDISHSDYLQPEGFYTKKFTDKQKINVSSLYSSFDYTLNNEVFVTAIARTDGASNMQANHRWFFSPSINTKWDITKYVKTKKSILTNLSVNASYGRLGTLNITDQYGAGPQYVTDLGWSSNKSVGSYGGIGTLSRPYTSGWIGYDIPWAYVEELDLGIDGGFFDNRLQTRLSFYSKNNKRMVLGVPVNAESGYTKEYKSGMDVNNKGIELAISSEILKASTNKLGWTTDFNIAFNKNTLKALPNNLKEITIGTQKLTVGKPVDQILVLQSQGVYQTDVDVPVNPATFQLMTYKGLKLHGGDPKWKDQNGDYVIDENDKVAMGGYMPRIVGNFNSTLSYKGFNLDFNIYFALKRSIINQSAANQLDFINKTGNNNINSVNEITFWQQGVNVADYPIYNPWSAVQSYRSDQDIFIENGSYAKLRSISLGYDISRFKYFSKNFKKIYVYASALNVYTLKSYTGGDPELVNYVGEDTGYGLPLPRTFTLGLKIDL